jgi:hypothetical protein
VDEKRVFGYCAECEDEITDLEKEYFINEDGEVFCCIECVLERYGVYRMEI